MIRFRHQDDERRYLQLRSQIYRRIAASLPPDLLSEVMGNFGKLELLLQLEGIRQGIAVQTLSALLADNGTDLTKLRAFQLHAHIYGSQDTPLSVAETGWLEKLNLPLETGATSTLDKNAMRFAPRPMKLEEPAGRPSPAIQTDEAGIRYMETLPPELAVHFEHAPAVPPDDERDIQDLGPLDSEDLGPLVNRLLSREDASPSFIDRIRSSLLAAKESGWTPETWTDLVLRLHQELTADAAYIDIQLCTEMGRTVLDQVGLMHLQPGPHFTPVGATEDS